MKNPTEIPEDLTPEQVMLGSFDALLSRLDDERSCVQAAVKLLTAIASPKVPESIKVKLRGMEAKAFNVVLTISKRGKVAAAQNIANAYLLSHAIIETPENYPPDPDDPQWQADYAKAQEAVKL